MRSEKDGGESVEYVFKQISLIRGNSKAKILGQGFLACEKMARKTEKLEKE